MRDPREPQSRQPDSWTTRRAKFLFAAVRRVGFPEEEPLSASQQYGVVPQRWLETQNDARVMTAFKGLETFQLVKPDNFVISLRSFQGGIEHSAHVGVISPAYTVLEPAPHASPAFFRHYLKSREFISRINAVVTGIRDGKTIKYDEFGELAVPLPPLPTQRAIADFLDRKTAAIDALIEKKQKLLDLLAEKRTALINRAVTKGLDPGVPMKDSGVPWIGEIPAHWEVKRLKHYFENLNFRRIPLSTEVRSERNGPYPYYGASSIIDHIDDYLFDEPTLLVAEDGANLVLRNLPLVLHATGKYWVNNHAHILRPTDAVFEFWAPLLESLDYAPFISGSAQPKLTSEALNNVVLAAPPTLSERRQIGATAATAARNYRDASGPLVRQIEKLQEYRQALITAAVTGQIDVEGA